jgi:chaperonin GroES
MAAAGSKRLVPLLNRVLVEKIVAPSKSIGGVLLPESASKVRFGGCTNPFGPGSQSLSTEAG